MLITVAGNSALALRRKLLRRITAYPTEDPELLCEAPALLSLERCAFQRRPWRTDTAALVTACGDIHDVDGIAASIQAHYRERLPESAVDRVARALAARPFSKKVVLSLWKVGDLTRASGSSCINYIWFRNIGDGIGVRAHMRACDIVRKLVVDLYIIEDTAAMVAERAGASVRWLQLFVDCAHVYRSDESLMRSMARR